MNLDERTKPFDIEIERVERKKEVHQANIKQLQHECVALDFQKKSLLEQKSDFLNKISASKPQIKV